MQRIIVIFCLLLPNSGLAQACATAHPDWDGAPATVWDELFALSLSPISLILLGITLVAIRFRSQWGGLIAVVLWSGFVTLITMADPTGLRGAAQVEGCIGSPALFIAFVAAICIGTILYTAPVKAPKDGDT